jgi:DNA-binding beta-propeller fold protein YncE
MRSRAVPGEFRSPQGISVDNAGNMFQVFRPNGQYRNDIGAVGLADGQFRYPMDSAVDRDGRVLVLNQLRVEIFDARGNHVRSFGNVGWAEEDFISRPAWRSTARTASS